MRMSRDRPFTTVSTSYRVTPCSVSREMPLTVAPAVSALTVAWTGGGRSFIRTGRSAAAAGAGAENDHQAATNDSHRDSPRRGSSGLSSTPLSQLDDERSMNTPIHRPFMCPWSRFGNGRMSNDTARRLTLRSPRLRRLAHVALAVGLASGTLHAQAPAALSLSDALARATDANRTVLAARMARAVDLAGIDAAGQRPNPEICRRKRARNAALGVRRHAPSRNLRQAAAAASTWPTRRWP